MENKLQMKELNADNLYYVIGQLEFKFTKLEENYSFL